MTDWSGDVYKTIAPCTYIAMLYVLGGDQGKESGRNRTKGANRVRTESILCDRPIF